MSIYVPPELVETIVQQLVDFPHTLHACAFVCKVWLPIAYRILFNDFTIYPGRSFGTKLIFPHYVSRLTLARNLNYRPQVDEVVDLFRQFDRVRVLSVIEHANTRLIPLLPSVFPQICHLTLTAVPFDSPRSLHALIAAFLNLESLQIYPIFQGKIMAASDYSDDPPPPPHLRAISYDMEDTPRIPFLRWISAQPPPVEHLTLGRLHPADFQSTDALLRALGPQLKVLDIYFSPKSPPAHISTELSLSTNVQLHTLILHMPPRHESHPHDPADAPLSLLANAGPALRRAVFVFHAAFATFGWNTFGRVLDWPAFDTVLARRVPALEALVVQVQYPKSWGTLEAHALERLENTLVPQCVERGVLAGLEVVPL